MGLSWAFMPNLLLPFTIILAQVKHCFIPFCEGEPPPPRSSTSGACRIQAQWSFNTCLPVTIICHFICIYKYTDRNTLLVFYKFSTNVFHHAPITGMTAHTPTLTSRGVMRPLHANTTEVAVEHSRYRSHIGSLWQDGHPSKSNWAHGCLTSVIGPKMLTPSPKGLTACSAC